MQAQAIDPQVILNRVIRVLRLDASVFEEVRDDASFLIPSVAVAAICTLLMGLGGFLWWLVQGFGDKGKVLIESFILGSVFSVALWFVWLGVAYFLITNVFGGKADFQRMVRTAGIAAAPLAIAVLMLIPLLDFGIGLAAVGLFFFTTTAAINAAAEADSSKIFMASAAGFAVWAVVLSILSFKDTYLAPGPFLFESLARAMSSIVDVSRSFRIG